jgi:hypothetical protein
MARKSASMRGDVRATAKGFEYVPFTDLYGAQCSLQQSSLATFEQPGSSAIWLGVEDCRMHLDRSQVAMLIAVLKTWYETGSFIQGIDVTAIGSASRVGTAWLKEQPGYDKIREAVDATQEKGSRRDAKAKSRRG